VVPGRLPENCRPALLHIYSFGCTFIGRHTAFYVQSPASQQERVVGGSEDHPDQQELVAASSEDPVKPAGAGG